MQKRLENLRGGKPAREISVCSTRSMPADINHGELGALMDVSSLSAVKTNGCRQGMPRPLRGTRGKAIQAGEGTAQPLSGGPED